MCSGKSRTMHEQHMTTQLWFLPVGSNGLINDKITALLEILLNSEFKKLDYHYYTYVDRKKGLDPSGYITYMENPHRIKDEIEDLEDNIRKNRNGVKGKNLIILTGNRLQLGISLKNVDIVVMWNSVESTDSIFQMLFRSMTEVNITECNDTGFCPKKKWGFMVDLNPQRSMTNVNLFSENINYAKKDSDKTKEYRQIIDLIDIDGDIIQEVDNDDIINELFNKLYESWDRDVESIKKITENFSYSPIFISQIEEELRIIKFSNKTKKIIVQETEDKIDAGNKKEKISEKDKKQSEKEKKTISEIPIDKLAAELIAELISLLNIFTLYLDGNSECILLNDYKKNKNININIMSDINKLKKTIFDNEKEKSRFLKILNGRLGGNENESYSDKVVNTIIKSISNTRDISHMEKIIFDQKFQYYGITKLDKLLDDINNNLAPKDKEKKERGEVFTPLNIVTDMLNQLPTEVWENPDLKWLDPAVGIGNFPVKVYERLMVGLKNKFPDKEERSKHILEKMIYMVEVSEKSIFILNKVFCGIDGGGQYKLNIFHGSFVINRDTKDGLYKLFESFEDGTKMFDIVIGNPPYNFIHDKRTPGYPLFAVRGLNILNKNGYINFIIPNAWKRSYSEKAKTKTGKILDAYKKYYLKYLKLNLDIKYFPNVDIIVLQKTINKQNTIVEHYNYPELRYNDIIKSDIKFLPNIITKESINIINSIINLDGDKLFIRNDRTKMETQKEKSDDFPYKIFDYTTKENKKQYNWSNKKTRDFDKSKIIMAYNKSPYILNAWYDSDGNIGSTGLNMYMATDKSYLVKFLNSKLIKFILINTQYASPPNPKNDFKILNMITYPDRSLETDQEIYEYYKINKTQQEFIEEIINNFETSKKKKKKLGKKTPELAPESKKLLDENSFDKYISETREKIINMKINKYPYKDETFPTWGDFFLHCFDDEKEKHFKKLSENELKKELGRYVGEIKKWRKKKEQELALERKKKREEKDKTLKVFIQPKELNPEYIQKYNECIKSGKLWNIKTKRSIKDTPENRKIVTIKK